MTGEATSSNRTGHGGSNALSHAYIQNPALRCQLPGLRNLFYDDGNKLLLGLISDQVLSWKTAPYNPYVAPSSDPINEGPVVSIRYSLDLKLLGIQRSRHEIQVWNKETGQTFSQKCKSESENILGFFWTDCSTCGIVFVKTSGLELYSCNSESKSLQLVDTKKLSISWYIYTHESRLVLLASGMQCKNFSGYQLSSAGIIRLPKFEMVMAKSEANSKPILAAEDVHIITVYGRIYCLQFDKVAMLLHLYRFYRDAVVQQGSLPVYSNRIALNVVDNILLVHQVDAKVVILYDIYADERSPVSAPLPLLFRDFSRANLASSLSSYGPSGFSASKDPRDSAVTIYGDNWRFFVPDLVCDISTGFLWKVHIDLDAISASSSEVPLMLEFLQRRKLDASKAKHLCLAIVRTTILEQRPVFVVAKAIDVLLTTYGNAIKTGSYYKRTKADNEVSSTSSTSNVYSPEVDKIIDQVDASGKSKKEPETSFDNGSHNSCSVSTSDSDVALSSETKQRDSSNQDSAAIKLDIGYSVESKEFGAVARPSANVFSELHEPETTSASVSPADLQNYVFGPVEEEMAGDGSYLVSVIVEFLRSVSLEKLKVQHATYVLMVQILARYENYNELGMLIVNKIIEPSKEVALQLLESGRRNSQVRKWGLDMLRQLSLHHDYVLLLVQDGYYLEALRYARKNKVNTVKPSLFLEAAHSANEPQHLAAVLRFFSDFIPGFKSTSDYHVYHRIIGTNTNSLVIA